MEVNGENGSLLKRWPLHRDDYNNRWISCVAPKSHSWPTSTATAPSGWQKNAQNSSKTWPSPQELSYCSCSRSTRLTDSSAPTSKSQNRGLLWSTGQTPSRWAKRNGTLFKPTISIFTTDDCIYSFNFLNMRIILPVQTSNSIFLLNSLISH